VPATPRPDGSDRLGLAEPLAALSLVTDLARGHPPEEAIRACLLATELGRRTGLRDADLSAVYFTTLLRFIGCTATSHEYAGALGGDDIAARGRGDRIDPTAPREALAYLFGLSEGRPLRRRASAFGSALRSAKGVIAEGARADCEVGAHMARRFELDPAVEEALLAIFERWDGKGAPRGLAGEAIPFAARYAALAFAVVMFASEGGRTAATEVVSRWSGRVLDPALVTAFVKQADDLLEVAAADDAWTAVLDAEPRPVTFVSDRRLDEVARGFADAVDLKSPFFLGHSSGVAHLAERAGTLAGLGDGEVVALRRAGLLHDLGRAGIPTGIWEKPGPLSVADWEQVRLHPYHTERILSRSTALRPLAALAGLHHERLDGTGYYRGATAGALDGAARILAAADTYHALTEPRPHRPAFDPPAAARRLEATPGLDRPAVEAVLAAAGQEPSTKRPSNPAGLTEREIEVLRSLVTGRTEAQIAGDLFVSASTVHTHVVHIYAKAGRVDPCRCGDARHGARPGSAPRAGLEGRPGIVSRRPNGSAGPPPTGRRDRRPGRPRATA
jgi:HD-GYP domain-containing protein (c-di-GMP phosphodiesterase class II)